MSADEYPGILLREMEADAYITPACVDICPPSTTVEKKQANVKEASNFHLYYFSYREKQN